MKHKAPVDFPIEYLERRIDYFEKFIEENNARHLEEPLLKTRKLLEAFKKADFRAISIFYETNKNIGENHGTGFFQVLRFVTDYLKARIIGT